MEIFKKKQEGVTGKKKVPSFKMALFKYKQTLLMI